MARSGFCARIKTLNRNHLNSPINSQEITFVEFSGKFSGVKRNGQIRYISGGQKRTSLASSCEIRIFFIFIFFTFSAHEPDKGHVSRVTRVTGLGHHY